MGSKKEYTEVCALFFKMKKLIYVILDGASDKPIKELGNKTPFETAYKPYLDSLAGYSKLGMMSVVRNDIAPESDEAMLALLGFDPFTSHKGRGPLEALGADVISDIRSKVILRCNFAKEEKGFITDTEAIPSSAEMKKITRLLNKIDKIRDVKVSFVPTTGHRAVLILKGKNLSPKISNTNPSYVIKENFVTSALPKINLRHATSKPLNKTPEAVKTAQIVNSWHEAARKILAAHKFKSCNMILSRGAGNEFPTLKKFKQRWALLADMPVEKAIGKLCGMKILEKPASLKKTAETILKNLEKFDGVYIEIKGPDAYAHKGNPAGKKQIIEKIDREFFKPLLSELLQPGADVKICVTADHTTACATKAHTSDPVPVLIYSPGSSGDNINKFGEHYCSQGSLHFISAVRLFEMLKW